MTGQQARRIFFWILAAFFLVMTVTIVFYAIGYRFNFERGIFIYGGSITIKSNPKEVEIALNNKAVSQKKINFVNNSYHIDGIKPGEYQLKVSAPGFESWSKKILVRSGVSTEFWNILLTRKEYNRNVLYYSLDKKFYVSPDNKQIAFSRSEGDNFIISVMEIDSMSVTDFYSSKDLFLSTEVKEAIVWSPRSNSLIVNLIGKVDGSKKNLLINIEDKVILDLNEITGMDELSRIKWDTEAKNVVFFLSEKKLYRLKIDDDREMKLLAEDIASFNLAAGEIFYFQIPGGIVSTIDRNGNRPPQQVSTSPPANMDDSNYDIVVYDKDRIAYANYNSGQLYIWNKGEKNHYFRELLSGPILQGVQFSDDGKKLLFGNEREIFVYFTRDWKVQPNRVENETIEVTRFLSSIGNIQWAKNYEHIVFTAEKKVKVTEIDRRDHCNIFDLFETKSDNPFIVNWLASDKIFFTDKDEDSESLFTLFAVDFPERENFFSF